MVGREGEQVGNYRLIKALGHYAYLSEDIANRNRVAIKLLFVRPYNDHVKDFLREAALIIPFKHPNILQVFNYGIDTKNGGYVVMQYAPGGSFHDHYPAGTILPLTTVLSFVKQIASALQYIQDSPFFDYCRWLTYFAVRPATMLFDENGKILLSGFVDAFSNFLSSEWDEDRLASDEFLYVAFEQFGGKYTKASMQYSLAITVYEWLCGSLPFLPLSKDESTLDAVLHFHHEQQPKLRQKNPSIPQAVSDVVMKALAKKPEDRYESITAFAEAFERAATSQREDGIGEQFGQFRTVRLLGHGDIGKVYVAEPLLRLNQSNAPYAIKVLQGLYDKELFRSYAQALTQLQHPNILPVREYGVKDGSPYLLMDYAYQGTLLDRHPRGTTLPIETILSYVKQIASALQYAHERNIYGDVRPKKIFIGPNNAILMSGFDVGLNKEANPRRKVAKDYFKYRAPERTQQQSSAACDQYSLAIMVYEWLSGNVPFRGESVQIAYQHRRVTPPSMHEKNPSIAHEVEKLVMKALSKDPEKRYESIQDFAKALEKAVAPSKRDSFVLPDRSGEQFGKYRLVRRLGQGGFAEVYLGQHIKLKNFVAIKMLYAHLTPKQLEELENEAQVVASLSHPSIVRVFDVDIERNIPFLVMDYAPNGTMRQFHAKGSRLSLPTVVKYVKQIADALQLAHDQKIIHRDVKPENMLLGANDTIMLSDFGLAVIAHSTKSWKEQDRAGTAKYMAPEQYKKKAVPASDQYSLAVVAYEWLCGAPPFDEGEDIHLVVQHLQESVPPMNERGAVVSQEVEQVIVKALAKEPTERFGSVNEFAEALEKAAQGGE